MFAPEKYFRQYDDDGGTGLLIPPFFIALTKSDNYYYIVINVLCQVKFIGFDQFFQKNILTKCSILLYYENVFLKIPEGIIYDKKTVYYKAAG